MSFLLVVIIPLIACGVYLKGYAKDQYASHLGFSVRSEGLSSGTLELLGGITGLSESTTSDPDILYKFLTSSELVQRIDERLDLVAIWSRAKDDPVFAYQGGHTIEDLVAHWERMVSVYSDSGMLDVRVLAFDATDAQKITEAIFDESSSMINDLNAVARADSIRYAREELDKAVERLKVARQTMTEFRNRYQLVDPVADVQGQLGILSSLQQQLAEALINRGILDTNAREADPRIEQADVRIRVIREQIEQERQKFGGQATDGEQLSSVVGEYERLAVDREFAETTYTAALAAYDLAQAQAQQKSRYLAAYVKPTLAQTAEYPQRLKIFLITASFLLLIWTIGVLIYYSVRNRR
ncbi:sugar transporter [Paracoccus aurantiacus]|uniref:sugar transporter n=1 Tax=Paracoccus aurantiacus TaxID=2599412 RepID=UPI001FE98653|nr:sugar transporter [Paracoccus aurantiacus]